MPATPDKNTLPPHVQAQLAILRAESRELRRTRILSAAARDLGQSACFLAQAYSGGSGDVAESVDSIARAAARLARRAARSR